VFPSERDQGHVSNFYIVDLENFATASRRYTGDIHNSSVVGLFIAKFHYTDTDTDTDFFAEKLRWVRAGPCPCPCPCSGI